MNGKKAHTHLAVCLAPTGCVPSADLVLVVLSCLHDLLTQRKTRTHLNLHDSEHHPIRVEEMSKRLGRNVDCKDKTSHEI